jgi:hypothetical protein
MSEGLPPALQRIGMYFNTMERTDLNITCISFDNWSSRDINVTNSSRRSAVSVWSWCRTFRRLYMSPSSGAVTKPSSQYEVSIQRFGDLLCLPHPRLMWWVSGRVHYCWPSPAQSFLVPSPTGLLTILYYLTTLEVMLSLCDECRVGYITAGPRQHSHSWFRVPRDSWLYYTVTWLSKLCCLSAMGVGSVYCICTREYVPSAVRAGKARARSVVQIQCPDATLFT